MMVTRGSCSLSTFRLGCGGSCCVCSGNWLVGGATRIPSLLAFRDGHLSGCARGCSCCSLNRPIIRLINCCEAAKPGTLSVSLVPNCAVRRCRMSVITWSNKSFIWICPYHWYHFQLCYPAKMIEKWKASNLVVVGLLVLILSATGESKNRQ